MKKDRLISYIVSIIEKIMRLLEKEKLSNIKIQKSFEKHPPRPEKMIAKWNFYQLYGTFSQSILLDKDNYLIDGYTTYIIASSLDKKYVKVKRMWITNRNMNKMDLLKNIDYTSFSQKNEKVGRPTN